MATRLSYLHAQVNLLLNQEARKETPPTIDGALRLAAVGRQGELIGSPKQYQSGRPVPAVSAQLTSRDTHELQAYQREASVTVQPGGVVVKPTDFAYPLRLTARYSQGEDMPEVVRGVDVVTDDVWDYRTDSRTLLARASQDAPVARVTRTGWLVYPVPSTVAVAYYCTVPEFKMAYVLDATGDLALDPTTGEPIPDDANTVDVPWLEFSDAEILRRAIHILSTRTADSQGLAFAQSTAQQPA